MGLHCAAYRNGSRIPFRFRRGGLHKSVAPSNHEYVESQLSNEIDNRINLRSRVTYILISKLRTNHWILLLMPLYVQSFIRYWKDSKSRDLLPYHSFSKMQLIYLVTRTWKIFWFTLLLELLKNRDSEFIFIFVLIKFDRRELKTISLEESARSPRSVFRSLRSSREKEETRSRRTNGNGKRWRFHGVVSLSS